MGTSHTHSFTQMAEDWGKEKQYFNNEERFPNVSTTKNWSDVGHYTQMVWENTTYLGCGGTHGSDGNYRFVCRHPPPGIDSRYKKLIDSI